MPPKQKAMAPIDRPLSRAYLRGFTGWSTAFPPGASEPTSLRVMENMWVERNGALSVRPGLRYLSYAAAPDMDPLTDKVIGLGCDRPLVGGQEPFYLEGGAKALLFAVREPNKPDGSPGSVGFRAILFKGTTTVVYPITAPEIGFKIPQGEEVLNFPPSTTHVEYLQINNRIVAMSDKGESLRLFFVGGEKVAKKMNSITVPDWTEADKLAVVHPNTAWINKQTIAMRHNVVLNPSFELGGSYWSKSANCDWSTRSPGVSEGQALAITSKPARVNMQTSPLHDVKATGIAGWHPHKDWGNPKLSVDDDYMKIYETKKGLFLAYGAKLSYGVEASTKYQVALDYQIGAKVQPVVVLTFYGANGAKIGNSTTLEMPKSNGRYASKGISSPVGTTTMRVSVGGRAEDGTNTFVKVKNVILCKENEVTTFFSGASGADNSWLGAANASPSVHWPAQDITLTCQRVAIPPSQTSTGSIHVSGSVAKACILAMQTYNKDGVLLTPEFTGTVEAPAGSFARISATGLARNDAVSADLQLRVPAVAKGQIVYVDAAMINPGSGLVAYFDGNTAGTPTSTNAWADSNLPHQTISTQTTAVDPFAAPDAGTPAANTLVSSDPLKNTYKLAFFYTFENEMGESAPSKIVEQRVMRPWSNWFWQQPNGAGEPDAAKKTDRADLCADQLVVKIPAAVYAQAIAEGATKWNLYAMSWSDQEPVPPLATQVGSRELYSDTAQSLQPGAALTHEKGGWFAINPSRRVTMTESMLPTLSNRVNYSKPPRTRTGLVAGDRMILVGDPSELATIRWTSNRFGEYTNFTAAKGGGSKTLTSGNLNIPADVVLWQNPQSVDTLAILCMGADGQSSSYYMSPATVSAGSSGSIQVMGFEETTSTPGTMSPYGAQVLNNALYRPIDRSLLKSTAQNYNINHKAMTDKIANVWVNLRSKQWVMSAQLDNRLFYLVHNPLGELLQPGCKGNEIWVLDLGIESNPWSRFLIQAHSLRPFDVGPRTYMGITTPDGLYYLDHQARVDDYVDPATRQVLQRPIEWSCETNTQGANRAHDAWAHLQQVGIILGNFKGSIEYGVRGWDLHGRQIDVSKRFTDDRPIEEGNLTWDIEDMLQIRRDMKEWVFYANSVESLEGSGQVTLVQYRYTPVSVNVGYEYGSIETFEYGANVSDGNSDTMANGIPRPYVDYTRP